MSLPLPRIYGPTSPGASVTSLLYLYDATGVMVDPYTNVARSTGIFRAIEPWDLAPTISSLNISGINVNTDQLETIDTSGVQFLASISGFTAAISGQTAHAYTSVSNSTISGSMSAITTGIGLAANANRKRLYAQVVGSGGPLFLNYGASAASATAFNVILAPATADIGSNGGVLSDADYKGQVMVSGFVGARWMLWEGL